MGNVLDTLRLNELVYECDLGFHPSEKGIRQRIRVDLEISLDAIARGAEDRIDSIRLDYFEAEKVIAKLLENRHYNLVETVAEKIAKTLLEHFAIRGVMVTVTKYPINIPTLKSVSYTCFRERSRS